MLIHNIISSISESCGISIFNRHLCEFLTRRGNEVTTSNIISKVSCVLKNDSVTILHYTPSAFSTENSSYNLIKVLQCANFSKLVVIFHGIYRDGENRFIKDAICPFQNEQLEIIFKKATYLLALSKSVENNLKTWMLSFDLDKTIYRLYHPGLFALYPTEKINTQYAFLGGILRPKKNYKNERLINFFHTCRMQNLDIWMHWSNLNDVDYQKKYKPLVWKNTMGLQSDENWTNIISNSKVVLCPYETKIQSVSGLIAEAISAHCFVLTTTFDFSIEMKTKYPLSVILNDDLTQWPILINELFKQNRPTYPDYYCWEMFVNDFNSNFLQSDREVMIDHYIKYLVQS